MAGSSVRALPTSPDFSRGLEGFQRRVPVERESTGIPELDAILDGGVPRGSIVELCGPGCSGRTSLSFSVLAKATERQELCAYVDVCDALDPVSLASAGVDLKRVLWVRCGGEERGGSCREKRSASGELVIPAQEKSLPFLENTMEKKRQTQVWRHPRDQIRGIEGSIPGILGNGGGNGKAFSPAVNLAATEVAEAGVLASCAEGQTRRARVQRDDESQEWEAPRRGRGNWQQRGTRAGGTKKPWKILEQALRTTDLLLHSGGWGVVVFDLGNISWVDARRIEMSTWFRFRRAIEYTPTILLLVGEEACAKSCSSLVLQCKRKREMWSSAGEEKWGAVVTLDGFEVEGKVACSRTGLRGMESARWRSEVRK
jgi:recombination protein RecA